MNLGIFDSSPCSVWVRVGGPTQSNGGWSGGVIETFASGLTDLKTFSHRYSDDRPYEVGNVRSVLFAGKIDH